jgi:hypothetical protein
MTDAVRLLIGVGHGPDLPLQAYCGDVLCLRVKSIGADARLDVKKDGKGPRFVLACVLEEQPAAETYRR